MTEQRPTVRIAPAEAEHFAGMAEAHLAAFPGEFLTLLGPAFLRAFYGYFSRRPDGISLVALDEAGRLIGLVTGGAPALRSKFLRRHLARFLATAFVKSFVHDRVRRRMAEHFVGGLKAIGRKLRLVPPSAAPAPPDDPPGTWSNLLSICTAPEARGRGVGKALLEAYRAESARRGYKTMRLSVHNDNPSAIALYQKCGWRAVLTTQRGTYFKRGVESDS